MATAMDPPPLASTSASIANALAPASVTTTSASDALVSPSVRKVKKKKQGRGREMMVKVFYSLNTPRPNNSSSSNNIHNSPAPAPSPAPASASTPAESPLGFPLDPALASLPASTSATTAAQSSSSTLPPTPFPFPQQQSYTCIARLQTPVWVQLLGPKPTEAQLEQGVIEYGRLTLKTCLSAICISKPELVTDPSKDYAVSSLDPYESSLAAAASHSTTSAANGQGLMEGKGMLSWNLAEKREGTTWVCGRVVPDEQQAARRRTKKRKGDDGFVVAEEEEESSADEEIMHETLEVWLQLVERPSFTQMQFLTSLRSFANPAQPHDSSDRASPPPRRREQMLSGQPALQMARVVSGGTAPLGDPVKRKRPRDSGRPQITVPLPSLNLSTALPSPLVASSTVDGAEASAQPTTSATAILVDDPRIAALLAQLLPSLTASSTSPRASSIESEDARQLLPAIRTLAQYYGVSVPSEQANSAMVVGQPILGKKEVSDEPSTTQPEEQSKAKSFEAFTPIPDQAPLADGAKGRSNPADAAGGCFNCKRKKSTVWRQSHQADGTRVTCCNACGAHYNKYGRHRTKGERTSPAFAAQEGNAKASTSTAGAPACRGGKPLQGRLTAACESDLKKVKTTKKGAARGPGKVAPPSPSKIIGPRHTQSGSLGHYGAHSFTSPQRHHSAARLRGSSHRSGGSSNPFGFTATSPTRAGHHPHPSLSAAGLRSGYESDGEGRGVSASTNFASIFGIDHHSPSPERPSSRNMPAYLLTASPGTALDRILNDTNIDLDSFSAGLSSATGMSGLNALTDDASLLKDTLKQHLAAEQDDDKEGTLDRALSMYLSSLNDDQEKENERPGSLSTMAMALNDGPSPTDPYAMIDPALLPPSYATSNAFRTDAPTTDADPFESVLSSLRRDFNTRLSSNALTAPSSPTPSSPCVQPRTSSATPGSKGKGPASCGRPAPSIVDSFLDGLVPALAFNTVSNGDTPLSEPESWTLTSFGQNDDVTMTLDAFTSQKASTSTVTRFVTSGRTSGGDAVSRRPHHPAAAKHLQPHISTTTTSDPDFDFGSLPPSSPPALPSEAGPTPSEFGSCITPDGEGFIDDSPASGAEDAVMRSANADASPSKLTASNLVLGLSEGSSATDDEETIKALLAGGAGGTLQLDRATVDKLLSMIGKTGSAPSTSTNGDEGTAEKMYTNMFA